MLRPQRNSCHAIGERASSAIVAETTVLGGISVISAYLRHSEGASPDNLRIVEELAASIIAAGPDWVLAMDANMAPEALRATNWEELIGG